MFDYQGDGIGLQRLYPGFEGCDQLLTYVMSGESVVGQLADIVSRVVRIVHLAEVFVLVFSARPDIQHQKVRVDNAVQTGSVIDH